MLNRIAAALDRHVTVMLAVNDEKGKKDLQHPRRPRVAVAR
jgi:hypothetical protein